MNPGEVICNNNSNNNSNLQKLLFEFAETYRKDPSGYTLNLSKEIKTSNSKLDT